MGKKRSGPCPIRNSKGWIGWPFAPESVPPQSFADPARWIDRSCSGKWPLAAELALKREGTIASRRKG